MPAGAPTKYKKEYCRQAEKLCRLGATDKDLADFFEVEESTINNWKLAHPEFLESIKEKDFCDNEIVASLHKRAKGYKRIVERITRDGVVPCTEEVPPDPTSMIFWLKNRQSAKWRDKTDIEHSGNVEVISNVFEKK